MSRSSLLSFFALGLFLVALPAALFKPGLPLALRGDEATWLGLTGSLLHDRDVDFSAVDAERVFSQFPFDAEVDFHLVSSENGRRYDATLLYPLLAAPFLGLLGSNGLLVFNLLLVMASIWVAGRFFDRRRLEGSLLLFATPFVLLSPVLIYAFWMRPSALLFFLGTLTFCEGWPEEGQEAAPWRRALAGVACGLLIAHLPYFLLLALPILYRLGRQERRGAAAFAVALVVALGLLAGIHQGVLGSPLPGNAGNTYTLEKASDEPWRSPNGAHPAPPPRPITGERLLLSPIDRRRGFLPYFPLALLALLLWRSPRREAPLLVALVVAILVQPWAGELAPGLPMNPALLPLYAAFLLFVRTIPILPVITASGLATLLLGLQLFGVLGSPIPDGGAHGHVRAFPFNRLPLDVEEIGPGSGLVRLELSGDAPAPVLWAAADQALLGGRELWTYGGETVELFLESQRPLDEILLQMRSIAVPNRLVLKHRGGEEVYDFSAAPAISQRKLKLAAGEKTARGTWIYRLQVASEKGAKPYWVGESEVGDYIGAAIAYIGTPEEVGRDLYDIDWLSCGFPKATWPAQENLALVRARNPGPFYWPSRGASRIRFASRWRNAEGQVVAENPSRSAVRSDIAVGEEVTSWLRVSTPAQPGTYTLEFDAVYENVGWFSAKNGDKTCRQTVTVVPKGS